MARRRALDSDGDLLPAEKPAPLTRPEAFRRIGNTLKRLGSDEDRRKLLAALTDLYGA